MGCDIHGYVEKQNADGAWERLEEALQFRNYQVFAALADVRNKGDSGFSPLNSLAGHRGLPEDCTVLEEIPDIEDMGYHSCSWATLEEIVSWEGWDQTLEQNVVLSREVYEKWDRQSGPPAGWCLDVAGHEVYLYEEYQIADFPHWNYVRVQFSWPLRQACQFFLNWCENIYKRHADKKLRLVFWFDN